MDEHIPFKLILDQTLDVVIVTEIDHIEEPFGPKIVYVNQAFTSLTGYTKEEVLGKTPRILQGEKTDKNVLKQIRHALENQEKLHVELINYAKDKTEYWLDFTIFPIKVGNNKIKYFAAIEHDITKQKQLEERLKHVAEHDPLTGLINRPLYDDRLNFYIKEAKRQKYGIAVCFLDIDSFKQVNDQYGHKIGDMLLQAATQRIQNCIRETDSFARFGGDEFGLILSGISGTKEVVEKIIKKILKQFSEPFLLEKKIIQVTLSVGVALYPQDGPDLLTEKADAAMYYVKKQAKNNYQFYNAKMKFR